MMENFDLMLSDLDELLRIESILDESSAEENSPFGKGLRNTLDWFLNKAKSYGLKTGELDGYCGYCEIGEGKELIGILGHLDVVPAGEGWSYPPYELTACNDFLYGRGVVDNKGCVVIAMHILKELKEKNIQLNNRIRLIVGCNEESGSLCIKHYSKYGEVPKMSIVPDADFPLINSEKGIVHFEISLLPDSFFTENFISISGGSRPNVVPPACEAVIKNSSALYNFLEKNCRKNSDNSLSLSKEIEKKLADQNYNIADFSLIDFEGNILIKTRGIAGHAMAPNKADNAIHKLFALLTALNAPISGDLVELIHSRFCTKQSKRVLDIDKSDEKSGELTINLGMVNFKNNSLKLTLDIRLPLCAKRDEILNKIMSQMPPTAVLKILQYSPNLYIDPNTQYIKTLLNIYSAVTKEPSYPVQTGGGTYAKELKNAVAFGPTFPNLITNIHNKNEGISVENFKKLYKIYYETTLALDKL